MGGFLVNFVFHFNITDNFHLPVGHIEISVSLEARGLPGHCFLCPLTGLLPLYGDWPSQHHLS